MNDEFVPLFYPTTMSDDTFMRVMLDLYAHIDDWYEDERDAQLADEFYAEFELAYFDDIGEVISYLHHSSYNFTYLAELIGDSFKRLTGRQKRELKEYVIEYWKTPIIRNYHTFLQTLITPYENDNIMRQMIYKSVFHTWRHTDYDQFGVKLYGIKCDQFYEELRILETYHIERLI